ncbi:MAG: enoyl-CoA hydratase [Lysobacterales bacterium]|jgi:enoyl-CoA hydratase/carnithine racemase
MNALVETELERGVLTVRLNRPEKKNALTGEMYTALADAIDRGARDRAVRVLLVTGTAGVFTAGNDIADFLTPPDPGEERPVNRFLLALARTEVPLVAAVDGMAVGVGTTMLLHFDQVFATERARFSLPFINLGLVPEAGSSMLLVETCGYRKAAELLMLGESFSAQEAQRYGIVNRLYSEASLLGEATAAARALAAKPRSALRATKRLMRRPSEPLETRIHEESLKFFEALQSPEAREALKAFLEKREPDFTQFD